MSGIDDSPIVKPILPSRLPKSKRTLYSEKEFQVHFGSVMIPTSGIVSKCPLGTPTTLEDYIYGNHESQVNRLSDSNDPNNGRKIDSKCGKYQPRQDGTTTNVH